jgi:hypothetical protein
MINLFSRKAYLFFDLQVAKQGKQGKVDTVARSK